MKNNIKEIKTTVLGLILIVLGVAYFYMPHFSNKELWEVQTGYLLTLFVGGILLVLAPDRIIDVALNFLKKK